MKVKPSIIVLFICLFVTHGLAFSCYICDSLPSKDLNNVCAAIADYHDSDKFIKDCVTQGNPFSYPYNDSSLWKGCRKFTQTFAGRTRVVRTCARRPFVTRAGDCFTIVTTSRSKPLIQTTCDCGTENCNVADRISISSLLFSFVANYFCGFLNPLQI